MRTLEEFVDLPDLHTPAPVMEIAALSFAVEDDSKTSSTKLMTLSDMLGAGNGDGKAPATTSIAAIPPDASSSAFIMKQLQDIQLLSTFANVYAFDMLYKEHPKGFDITDPEQASQFTRGAASCLNKAITEGMGAFLTIKQSTNSAFNKETSSTSLHTEFLQELFKPFNFGEASLKQLDQVLTSVTSALKDIKVGSDSSSASIDHMIFVYYFEGVQGLPDTYKVAKLRVFFLHVDNSTWKWSISIGKNTISHETFKFNMNYTDIHFEMNSEMVEAKRDKILSLVESMAGAKLDAIAEKIGTKVVVTQS